MSSYVRRAVPSETMEEKPEHILLNHFEPMWTWESHLMSHSWSYSEVLSSIWLILAYFFMGMWWFWIEHTHTHLNTHMQLDYLIDFL